MKGVVLQIVVDSFAVPAVSVIEFELTIGEKQLVGTDVIEWNSEARKSTEPVRILRTVRT